MTRQAAPATILALAALLLAGCAKRAIVLIEPAEFAAVISKKDETLLEREPVEYRLRAYDGRLIMRLFNPAGGGDSGAVTLLGERSYVIDPDGESHRLRGGTLAPASFMTLEFPPVYYYPYYYGPRVGFGLGFGTSYTYRHACFADDAFYGAGVGYSGGRYPRWRWKEGEVRVRLVFEHEADDRRFEHDFVFERRRVE